MGGAESPELREALEELDVVEEVAALVDMAAKRRSTICKKGAAQGWRRAADQSDLRTAREWGGGAGRGSRREGHAVESPAWGKGWGAAPPRAGAARAQGAEPGQKQEDREISDTM